MSYKKNRETKQSDSEFVEATVLPMGSFLLFKDNLVISVSNGSVSNEQCSHYTVVFLVISLMLQLMK